MRDDLPLEDAIGVVQILVETNRAVPPEKWIDILVAEDAMSINEGVF